LGNIGKYEGRLSIGRVCPAGMEVQVFVHTQVTLDLLRRRSLVIPEQLTIPEYVDQLIFPPLVLSADYDTDAGQERGKLLGCGQGGGILLHSSRV
ncbi:MAG TPA: hypothetical protein VFR81_27465, partial [Longimicrobium sp.]|nr:hypothetical protein [Longimicrobium sp.]